MCVWGGICKNHKIHDDDNYNFWMIINNEIGGICKNIIKYMGGNMLIIMKYMDANLNFFFYVKIIIYKEIMQNIIKYILRKI